MSKSNAKRNLRGERMAVANSVSGVLKQNLIAADTSAVLDFLNGKKTKDAKLVDQALQQERLVLPPIVLSELLMIPGLDAKLKEALLGMPVLELFPDFWQRLAEIRVKMASRRFKVNLTECMVALSCLDHGVGLISVNRNYQGFGKCFGLCIDISHSS